MFIKDMRDSMKSLKWYEWLMAAILIIVAAYYMIVSFVNPSANDNPAWLAVLNFISAVCGAFCIFLCAKADISNFAFGIVNTVVYIVYLAYWRIYGTLLLEVLVYFPVNIISWVKWAQHRSDKNRLLTKAKKLTVRQNVIVAAVIGLAAVAYHAILVAIGGTVPWLDAFTLSIGLVAVFLEMFRYREQYVWWIITDVIAVAMYIVHFDGVYLTKKIVYLIMAVIGLVNWVRLQKTENVINE